MSEGHETIHPVLLCGGNGTRLWPLSRPERPKQFLPLLGNEPLIVETARRVQAEGFAAPVCLGSERHYELICQTMQKAQIAPDDIILEPVCRNTGPAAIVAACAALRHAQPGEDPLVLLLPCDHYVDDAASLRASICAGAQAAREGHIVTIGVEPSRPETAYGYIEARAGSKRDMRPVVGFVEKPDQAKAASYIASGLFYWNSGILLFAARAFLAEACRYAPEMAHAAETAFAGAQPRGSGHLLDRTCYQAAPAVSVDVAILERTDRAVVLPAGFGWCDLGSWSGLNQFRRQQTTQCGTAALQLNPTGLA